MIFRVEPPKRRRVPRSRIQSAPAKRLLESYLLSRLMGPRKARESCLQQFFTRLSPRNSIRFQIARLVRSSPPSPRQRQRRAGRSKNPTDIPNDSPSPPLFRSPAYEYTRKALKCDITMRVCTGTLMKTFIATRSRRFLQTCSLLGRSDDPVDELWLTRRGQKRRDCGSDYAARIMPPSFRLLRVTFDKLFTRCL